MGKRSQLNINISPDLLKGLKQTAMKSGKTLTTLVSECIQEKINKDNRDKSEEERIVSIEKRVESIEKAISTLSSKRNLPLKDLPTH